MSTVVGFSDLIGHSELIEFLKRVIEANNVPKSLILYGEPGIGKTSLARLISMSVLCPNSLEGECCSKCSVCESILGSRYENVVELDAALKSNLEDVKPLLEVCNYRPKFSDKRFIIIDECQRLSNQAFSSMFKTLEESPGYNHFIFVTTHIDKIPDAVVSRSIKLVLKTPSNKQLNDFLDKISEGSLKQEWKDILIDYSWSKPRDIINAYRITRFVNSPSDLLMLLGHPSKKSLENFWTGVKHNHLPLIRYMIKEFKRNIPDQNHLINCLLKFLFTSESPWLIRMRFRVLEQLINLSSLSYLQDNLILDAWVTLVTTNPKSLEYDLLRQLAREGTLFWEVYHKREKLVVESPGRARVLGDKSLTLRVNEFLRRKI